MPKGNGNNGDNGGTPPPETGDGGERTFIQAEVDRIVKERVAREQARFADYDDLKKAAKELEKLRLAQMSEAEKLQAEIKAAQQQTADAKAAMQRADARARDTLIKAAIMAEAARQGVANPEDAYHLGDLGLITVDDEDKVAGADKVVTALVEAGRLPLRDKPLAPGLDGGSGGGDRSKADAARLSQEELIVAGKLGLTPEQYAAEKQSPAQKELSAAEELESLRAEVRQLRRTQGS